MAFRMSMVRLTEPTFWLASKSYGLMVDGDEPAATPLVVRALQAEFPDVVAPRQIESEQAVEAGRGEQDRLITSADFVAVLQVPVPVRRLDLEVAPVLEEFVARGEHQMQCV